jgi:hypothetical protein
LTDLPPDFTVNIISILIGVVIGVLSSFIANLATDTYRERKRHKRVVKAFIRELSIIQENIKPYSIGKAITMGTPVFSKLITELPTLKEETAKKLLLTYSDIRFYFRPKGALNMEKLKEVEQEIQTTILLLEKEVNNKS